ncbi:hypothetical protein [Geminicoccus harenae]|uniref:hypothetical protein n=1 Tax=Geminicoccus harenae TaxID=2498453 RepID=UPI00168B4642|nr:hypothetical protein [Geminicoccus harenae]
MLEGEEFVPVLRDPCDVILTVGDVQPETAVAEASGRSSVELEPRDPMFLSVGKIEREEIVGNAVVRIVFEESRGPGVPNPSSCRIHDRSLMELVGLAELREATSVAPADAG